MSANSGRPPKEGTAAAIRSASRQADRPKRPAKRVFSAEFKRRILDETERLAESGEHGAVIAFLRREGLYWSLVRRWRTERETGGANGLTPKKRGRKPTREPVAEENARLRKQLERAQAELRKAEIIIDVQKKLSALLGVEMPAIPDEDETP